MWQPNCVLTVGEDGSIYVAGETYSSDFPTTEGALDPTYNGYLEAFLVELAACRRGSSAGFPPTMLHTIYQ